MAISTAGSRMGIATATPDLVHAEMQILRNHLLAVGLREMQTPESYDAAEGSDESDIPTVRGGSSKYMYFAFTDSAQDTSPVYFGVRARYDRYFNGYNIAGLERYALEVFVTRTLGSTGVPLSAGAPVSFQPLGGNTNRDYYVLTSRQSQGDFIRYTGEFLIVALSVSASRQQGGNVGPLRCNLFLVIQRFGDAISVYLDRAGYSNTQISSTYSPPAIMASTLDNTHSYMPNVEARAGLIFDDNGTPVIAPIYGRDHNGFLATYDKLFTIPSNAASQGQIMTLDFTGVEKRYLCLNTPSTVPLNTSQHWLVEWE